MCADEGQQEPEPVVVDAPVIDTQEPSATQEPAQTEPPVSNEPVKYDIEGVGIFTADEIKEMKQGSLRQADYTRKTQELAAQRKESEDALKLFEYLRNNPHIVDAMKVAEANPNANVPNVPTHNDAMLAEVLRNQKAMEADMKMNELKAKYSDVDEVAIYNKAAELKTDDFEFVYKALNFDKVDMNSAIEQAKAQLKAELEANKNTVSTIVSTKQTSQVQQPTSLTAEEKRVALNMGISEEEYAKWKNK